MLALNVARPVSVERLIDGVWGDAAPNSVANALQVYVSTLRKMVGSVGLSIARNGATYTLEAALDDIDVERFQRLAAEGQSALRALEPQRALESLNISRGRSANPFRSPGSTTARSPPPAERPW